MLLERPSSEFQQRPPKATDVLHTIETEGESDFLFDPKVDISSKDEKGMIDILRLHRRTKDWWGLIEMAKCLSFLFPNQRQMFRIGGKEFEKIEAFLIGSKGNSEWFYSYPMMSLVVFGPDYRSKLELDDVEFERMRIVLDKYCKEKKWVMFAEMAKRMVILFPKRRSELKLDEEEFINMKTELDKFRNNIRSEFLSLATNLSVLYPDRKIELGLGRTEFNGMKDLLYGYRDMNDYSNFADVAMDLLILSADRAEITADGVIKLTYKKKDIVKKPKPLPIILRV